MNNLSKSTVNDFAIEKEIDDFDCDYFNLNPPSS